MRVYESAFEHKVGIACSKKKSLVGGKIAAEKIVRSEGDVTSTHSFKK